jgi:hypothetical protein
VSESAWGNAQLLLPKSGVKPGVMDFWDLTPLEGSFCREPSTASRTPVRQCDTRRQRIEGTVIRGRCKFGQSELEGPPDHSTVLKKEKQAKSGIEAKRLPLGPPQRLPGQF